MWTIPDSQAMAVCLGTLYGLAVLTAVGFLWAWKTARFETPEFTKYKVFNDCGPGETQPSALANGDRDPPGAWIPAVFLLMLAWGGLLGWVILSLTRG